MEIAELIDPFSAADELFAHIFFEKYLELYHSNKTAHDFLNLTKTFAERPVVPGVVKVDWRRLFKYCDSLFGKQRLSDLLTNAYMFRIPIFRSLSGDALVSNSGVIHFLASLPVQSDIASSERDRNDLIDVAAWEFFRQLVSKQVDPLDPVRIDRILHLIVDRSEEIDKLKLQCFRLAQDFSEESDLQLLEARIREHIRINVEKEIQSVLELDSNALREFINEVFSDDKAWIGIAGFIFSLFSGQAILTAGSALCALSSLGSKAFKSAASKNQKLRESDYALLYRLRNI